MSIKPLFLRFGRFRIQDGTQVRFWEDKWLGNRSFRDQYPTLYNIVRQKHATVVDVIASDPLNVSFRRALVGNKQEE